MEKFVVSARKYRPTDFNSVVGQKHITSTLRNAIERKQLAHAYLFCGPRGVGKTTCARIFAKSINCQNPKNGEACNECETCRTINEGRSLNIHELDAASNNGVDDIRTLIDEVQIMPQVGRYSVFIIDEVHMLSSGAFNAFLKTLEEPPQHAIFILATTEKHKILPTILSRCQIYDFNRIRIEDMVEYLRNIASKENVKYDEESLNLIAQKADGGMRDALSMFDKAVSFCSGELEYHSVATTLNLLDYDTYFRFTEIFLQGNYIDALFEFDRVLQNGFSARVFLSGLDKHMRDLIVAKGPGISLIEYTGALIDKYREQAIKISPSFLFNAISLLTETDGKLLSSSNSRLLVELTLMKLCELGNPENSGLGRSASVVTQTALPNISANNTAKVNVQQAAKAQPQPSDVVQNPKKRNETELKVIASKEPSSQPAPKQFSSGDTPQPETEVVVSHISSLEDVMKAISPRADINIETGERIIDPKSEEKLKAALEQYSSVIAAMRPRFINLFEECEIEKNKLSLKVLSEQTREEVLQNKEQILDIIAQKSDVHGSILLDITIKDTPVQLKPTKLEDRLQYISERTNEFEKLKNTFHLEAE